MSGTDPVHSNSKSNAWASCSEALSILHPQPNRGARGTGPEDDFWYLVYESYTKGAILMKPVNGKPVMTIGFLKSYNALQYGYNGWNPVSFQKRLPDVKKESQNLKFPGSAD